MDYRQSQENHYTTTEDKFEALKPLNGLDALIEVYNPPTLDFLPNELQYSITGKIEYIGYPQRIEHNEKTLEIKITNGYLRLEINRYDIIHAINKDGETYSVHGYEKTGDEVTLVITTKPSKELRVYEEVQQRVLSIARR